MRYIFLILFLPLYCYSQQFNNTHQFPVIDNKVVYSGVISLDESYNAAQLLKNAKIWLVKEQTHFNNQLTDKGEWSLDRSIIHETTNELFGVCRIAIRNSTPTNYYAFNAHLLFKDGKYKYEFSNFRSIGSNIREPLTKNFYHIDDAIEKVELSKAQANFIKSEMDGLIRDFKDDMLRKSDFNF